MTLTELRRLEAAAKLGRMHDVRAYTHNLRNAAPVLLEVAELASGLACGTCGKAFTEAPMPGCVSDHADMHEALKKLEVRDGEV